MWYILSMSSNTKGQNLIEYLLLVVAVILVAIYFLSLGGPFGNSVNTGLSSMVTEVQNLTTQIQF